MRFRIRTDESLVDSESTPQVTDSWFDNSVWLVQRLSHLRLNRLKVAGASTNFSTVRFDADRSMDSLATAALAVNAYYDARSNTLFVPAAMLQPPFMHFAPEARKRDSDKFSAEAADAAEVHTLGGLGALLAHEMTHAFDSTGRRFDAALRLSSTWTTTEVGYFDAQAQCLTEWYDSFAKPMGAEPSASQSDVDEKIADIGGLHIALRAIQSMRETTPHATERRVRTFFTAWAQNWCELSATKMAAYDAVSNAHARAHTRVNAAVALFDQFGGAFGCVQGSAMMRNEPKCRIW